MAQADREEHEIDLYLDEVRLGGTLVIPAGARGLVLFAHGSGSSRFSPRNRQVASSLQDRGFATLLFDLLSEDEEQVDLRTAALRFDIDLLAKRLAAVSLWTRGEETLAELPLGYFGSSTGAAAALIAAAEHPQFARAVVSRGGRADLARDYLPVVRAPVLLIVGGEDPIVERLNREAAARLRTAHELVVIPGATHLFEEPGALEEVARLAGDWFERHLAARPAAGPEAPA